MPSTPAPAAQPCHPVSPVPPLSYSWFERSAAATGKRGEIAWPDLCEWIEGSAPVVPDKDSLPLIKLGTFTGDHRSNDTLETIHGIEGDYDAEAVQPADAAQMLRRAGIEALIYTTRRHRPDAPRWRVLCPLSSPLPPAERHGLVARLNGALGGILAPESFTAAQSYYVGSVQGRDPLTCWRISGGTIDTAQGIVPVGPAQSAGDRYPLGDPDLAAPSLAWLRRALELVDPNDLDRLAWIAITASVKQSGWTLTDEATLRGIWDRWCAQYETDNPADNAKQWESLRNTQLGWHSLVRRIPPLKAELSFGPGPIRMPAGTRAAANDSMRQPLSATPYGWPDPRTLPTRQWLLGHWVQRGEVTAIVSPGGVGKTTIGHGIALSLASARALLGKPVHRGPHRAWIFNLEDDPVELERQVAAALASHRLTREECGDRLFLDSGLVQPLCTATENRDGFTINEDSFEHLTATIRASAIDTVIVDPFVSSHRVTEASNEAIDAVVSRWKRLAHETGSGVVLVHHTRKLNGREVTAEDGRGASALHGKARAVLTLNPMSTEDAKALGIDPVSRRSLVRIDMGKANRAPPGAATWVRIAGQSLGNATIDSPADNVGVATLWTPPDLLQGFTDEHLRQVQHRVAAEDWRENGQASDWVGKLVAEVVGLDLGDDQAKASVKRVLKHWIDNGELVVVDGLDVKGMPRKFVKAPQRSNYTVSTP